MSIPDRGRAAFAVALVLSGCATVQPRASFDEIQRTVFERTGQRVDWNDDSEVDAQAAAIDGLLAQELTAETAVQVALLSNRGLQAVYEELGVAQADLVQSGRLRNPVLDAEVRFPEGGGTAGLGLGIAQDLLSVLYLPLRRRVAEAEFEAAKLRISGAVIDLVGDVRAAFYELQAAEQLADMMRTVTAATEASADLARRLHAAGNVRDLDLDNEQALHEQARLDLASAELEAIERREQMNALLGLWGARTQWKAASRLRELSHEELTLEGLESRAIERSLELGVAQAEIARAARSLGLTRASAALPDTEIGAAAEREAVEGLWSVGPSMQVPIPLFDQGQPAVARARAVLHGLQERYAAEAVKIRADVRGTASRLIALSQREAHYRDVMLPLRQRVVEETQKEYNAMQVGAFQLLLAKQQEIETGARYIETLRDWWLARTELDQLLSGRRAKFAQSPLPRVHTARMTGIEDHGN